MVVVTMLRIDLMHSRSAGVLCRTKKKDAVRARGFPVKKEKGAFLVFRSQKQFFGNLFALRLAQMWTAFNW
jgi:hypothetical protein